MKPLTRRLLIAILAFTAGLSSVWFVRSYSSHEKARTSELATMPVANEPRITFEGILLKNSPHLGAGCGVHYLHQVAKYRVEKVISGEYAGGGIVVDHPACSGDVFGHLPVGSRLRVTVDMRTDYGVTTTHPGIRDDQRPTVFYIAADTPLKVADDE